MLSFFMRQLPALEATAMLSARPVGQLDGGYQEETLSCCPVAPATGLSDGPLSTKSLILRKSWSSAMGPWRKPCIVLEGCVAMLCVCPTLNPRPRGPGRAGPPSPGPSKSRHSHAVRSQFLGLFYR